MPYDPVAPGIDTEALLLAIATVETENGRDSVPRYERSYMPAGEAFTIQGHVIIGTGTNVNDIVRQRWSRWGVNSSASFSKWQILFHTAADRGFDGPPWELMNEAVAEPYVLEVLQHVAAKGAKTVRDFADAWNSGSFLDANVVKDYTDQVEAAYDKIIAARTA